MHTLAIRSARHDDLEAFANHVVRSSAESGQAGAPHFATSRTPARREVRDAAKARWAGGLGNPLWGRTWLLLASPHLVVGHAELQGGRVRAELHRATLGMAIELAFTSQGHGRRLIDFAIQWARKETKLAWIDLGVFADNLRARRLY